MPQVLDFLRPINCVCQKSCANFALHQCSCAQAWCIGPSSPRNKANPKTSFYNLFDGYVQDTPLWNFYTRASLGSNQFLFQRDCIDILFNKNTKQV